MADPPKQVTLFPGQKRSHDGHIIAPSQNLLPPSTIRHTQRLPIQRAQSPALSTTSSSLSELSFNVAANPLAASTGSPSKMLKLTFAEKQVAKTEKLRQKDERAKQKEEENARKEEEKRLKDEEKRKKAEEREAVKQVKDVEKAEKEAARAEMKKAKDIEKAAKNAQKAQKEAERLKKERVSTQRAHTSVLC
jgi:chromatin assembly factor 1 subunit A